MMCGGASETKDADKDVQAICDQLKDELAQKTKKGNFSDYTALKYRSQVVAGTNYFVKIQISPDECVHVRIFEPLPHTNESVSIHSYQAGKTVNDDLEYF